MCKWHYIVILFYLVPLGHGLKNNDSLEKQLFTKFFEQIDLLVLELEAHQKSLFIHQQSCTNGSIQVEESAKTVSQSLNKLGYGSSILQSTKEQFKLLEQLLRTDCPNEIYHHFQTIRSYNPHSHFAYIPDRPAVPIRPPSRPRPAPPPPPPPPRPRPAAPPPPPRPRPTKRPTPAKTTKNPCELQDGHRVVIPEFELPPGYELVEIEVHSLCPNGKH
nr:bromodomain-containing protein 4 isoform X2 [Drosophila suzukii]XP_036668597.1 bromodomain-containing protein 4 isoform X3 [Drosophila suzukii]